jgi:hypothetical protein
VNLHLHLDQIRHLDLSEAEWDPHFAFALASEVGPGFSPDIKNRQKKRALAPEVCLLVPFHSLSEVQPIC